MFLKKEYRHLKYDGKVYKGGDELPDSFVKKYGEQFKDRITDGKELKKNTVKVSKKATKEATKK